MYILLKDNDSEDIKNTNFNVNHKVIQKSFINKQELSDENIVKNELYGNEDLYDYETDEYYVNENNDNNDMSDNQSSQSDFYEEKFPEDMVNINDEKIKNELCTYSLNNSNKFLHSNSNYVSRKKEDDLQIKKNKIIKIYPKYQKLYNDTDTPISILINPQFASFFKIELFLFIKGYSKEEKVVIYLKSITPEIYISNSIHDIDTILINTCKTLHFDLSNNHPIDASITIENSDDYYKEYKIETKKFIIPANSKYLLIIVYLPTRHGPFEKTFIIHQKYTNVKKNIKLLGTCILPDLKFDIDEINFNEVSHSFLYEKSFHIINNSHLTLNYSFKYSNELNEEIQIIKPFGELQKYEKEQVVIKFCPKYIKTYFYNIEFFIEEIKTYKIKLPFHAICSKPLVLCEPLFLNLEHIIIDQIYTEKIKIINESQETDIKYEFIIEEKIKDICSFQVCENEGIIQRNSFKSIGISLKSNSIGNILIVIKIKIPGLDDFLFFNIKAFCTCPYIKIIPNIIDFEKCNCLDVKQKIIEIKNESPISTFITLSNENSVFTYSDNNFYVQPNKSIFINVYAQCLETITYNDILIVTVHRKDDIHIPIRAQVN